MAWAPGQAISGGWLEPLDSYMADANTFDAAWYDEADIFSSARSFQKWNDGTTYTMSITAEGQPLFVNTALLGDQAIPTTFDELYDTAKVLKTDDVAGIVLRAKPTGDASPWSAGGFIFSFGGAIIGLDGSVQVNKGGAVEAVDMYGKLLRDAGPVGASNYHWYECITDFEQGAAAFASDSSNFSADIRNPEKSTVSGNVTFAASSIMATCRPSRTCGIGRPG